MMESKSKESNNPKKDSGTLDETYIEHLFTKEAENPKAAHFLEGVDPKKAKLINNAVDEYKKLEEESKISSLREKIDISQSNFNKEPRRYNGDLFSVETSSKKSNQAEKTKSFIRKMSLVVPIWLGLLYNTINNKNSTNTKVEKQNISNEDIKQGILTEDEKRIRQEKIKDFINSKSDVLKTFEHNIGFFQKRIENRQKTLDSLSQDLNKNKDDVEMLENDIGHDKEMLGRILKLYKEHLGTKESLRAKEVQSAYDEFDKQKEYLREQIQTPEYKRRLLIEFNNDEKKVNKIIKERLTNLRTDYLLEERIEEGGIAKGAEAFFRQGETSHLPDSFIPYNKTTGIHEFEHQLTNANKGISKYSKDLYSKSYDISKVPDETMEDGQKARDYYGNITERDARKKELENDMQRLGIKEYGEKFTQKHYELLKKFQKEGKLSQEAGKFLETTKPQYFEKTMNTIAENKVADNGNEETLA